MFASLLTTIFFSLSVIFAAKSSRILGGRVANLGRICLATVLLAIWAHTFGAGLRGASLPWFFLSGVVGFGLGDMALFGSLTRIGPRLAIQAGWVALTFGLATLLYSRGVRKYQAVGG